MKKIKKTDDSVKSMKTCMCLFCTLAYLLLMGICPDGASCSDSDSHINFNHAIHDACRAFTHVSSEGHFCFERATTEHLPHKCCQHCQDFPFHFGCDRGLVMQNQTKSIAFAAFACTATITNNAGLAQDGLPSQPPGTVNAALPLLRTVILLI